MMNRELMSRRKIGKGLLALIAALGVFIVPCNQGASAASAPAIADTPCDDMYYESLSARAWLEAQREITQNQNLILKPDSVLEYTCFDLFLRELAQHAENMLSETHLFNQPLSPTSMDEALDALIGTSLTAYINANFEQPGYDLLGGHPAGTGIDHTPSAITGGAYSCDIMARVWQAAKCINFITNPLEDGFYTFQEYANSEDKRYLIQRCPSVASLYTANLNAALNSPPWTDDPAQTYLDRIDPSRCTLSTPIPTGVTVTRPVLNPTTYEEHICLPPGCRYVPVAAGTGRCSAS